jgi:fused signal recognition particle receptor
MFDGLKKKLAEAVKTFVKSEAPAAQSASAPVPRDEAPSHPGVDAAPQEAGRPADTAAQSQNTEAIKPTMPDVKPASPAGGDGGRQQVAHDKKPKEGLLKLSLSTKVKKVFSSAIRLNEREIDDFLEQIRISLLQSDVSFDVTETIVADMKSRLAEADIDSKNMAAGLLWVVKGALADVLARSKQGVDIYSYVAERIRSNSLPVKMLFIGSNGTGKTTTIGKIAYRLKAGGVSCVMSASDTFRAAAIEQTEYHANRIGVPVIKSRYGADPASIAFDAIAYAKAHGIAVVLMDSAGRQETNKNLINEMQKIVRVAQPDITIFVGESTAGSVIAEQIRELSKFVKIDGIILTKLDCDARGGNAISISDATGIPILFFGVGEAYDALIPYSPEFVINSVMPN